MTEAKRRSEKNIGDASITRVRRPAHLPREFRLSSQPVIFPNCHPPFRTPMARVSFSQTPPSALFSRVCRTFETHRTLTVLTFLIRDSSERPGHPHSGSGESVLELRSSSYVHILELSNHTCAVLITLYLAPGRPVPFRDTNREERTPGQAPARACPFRFLFIYPRSPPHSRPKSISSHIACIWIPR